MRSRRDAAAIALFVAGCAGARFDDAPPARAARRALWSPAWQAVVVPPTRDVAMGYGAWRAGREADGAVDLVAGGVRAVVRDGDPIAWARDATLGPLRAAVRDGEAWYFATADGGLFRADGFTGALVRLGDAAGRTIEPGGCDGAGALALSVDGGLWLGGGALESLRAAPAPLDRGLIAAGFADRAFGVAVVAPGRLFRTLDGGARFEPVDTGTAAPVRVALEGDAFVLETTAGLLRVGAAGDATPFTGPRPSHDRDPSPDEQSALDAGLLADYPGAFARAIATGGVMLGDGRLAVREDDGGLLFVGPRGGARRALPGASCDVLPWGAQLLATCGHDGGVELFASDGERPWSRLRWFASNGAEVASADGTTLVVPGACEPAALLEPTDAPRTPVCWFDGAAWRDRELPGHVALLGVSGERVAYSSGNDADDDAQAFDDPIRVASLADDEPGRPIALALPGAALASAAFGAGGLVSGLARRGEHRYAAVGTLAHPLALYALPAEATDVAFADARHGLAVGARLDQVFATDDGARTWRRLAAGVDGESASASLSALSSPDADATDARVACSAWACVAGSQLVWTAPSGAPSQRVLAAAHAAGARPDARDPWRDRLRAGQWECEAQRARAVSGGLAPERAYGGGGWLDARAAGAGRVQYAWGGADARGGFRASSRAAPIERPDGGPTDPGSAGVVPRALSRELAVFERCVRQQEACDLVVAPRDGTPRLVGLDDALLDADGARVLVQSAIALEDGGAVVHLAPARDSFESSDGGDGRVDAVLRFDARGALVARRDFAWSRGGPERLLAIAPEGPGLAALSASNAVTFYPLASTADARAWGSFPRRALPACAGEPGGATGALRVLTEGTRFGPGVRFVAPGDEAALHATVELDGRDGACLRAVQFWSVADRDRIAGALPERALVERVGGTPALEADHGRLVGRAVDAARTTQIVCRGAR